MEGSHQHDEYDEDGAFPTHHQQHDAAVLALHMSVPGYAVRRTRGRTGPSATAAAAATIRFGLPPPPPPPPVRYSPFGYPLPNQYAMLSPPTSPSQNNNSPPPFQDRKISPPRPSQLHSPSHSTLPFEPSAASLETQNQTYDTPAAAAAAAYKTTIDDSDNNNDDDYDYDYDDYDSEEEEDDPYLEYDISKPGGNKRRRNKRSIPGDFASTQHPSYEDDWYPYRCQRWRMLCNPNRRFLILVIIIGIIGMVILLTALIFWLVNRPAINQTIITPTLAPRLLPTPAMSREPSSIVPTTLSSTPTLGPTLDLSTPLRRYIVSNVALEGGLEFRDPTSYQSKALVYLDTLSAQQVNPSSPNDYIPYYSLASIYYASFGVINAEQQQDDNDDNNDNNRRLRWKKQQTSTTTPGWLRSNGWVTNTTNFGDWHGVSCHSDPNGGFPVGSILALSLSRNRMIGTMPPEVQLLAPTLQILNLYDNPSLVTDGDEGNQWLARMTNLVSLNIGTTGFRYPGIPSFFNQMTSLERLDVSYSNFSNGPIRGEAFRQANSRLLTLDLGGNAYTSTIPTEISNLSNLRVLFLDRVRFPVASQQERQRNLNVLLLWAPPLLSQLWVDFADFGGCVIPDNNNDNNNRMGALTSWSMASSGLAGTIPPAVGSLTNLVRLALQNNRLSGTIPTHLGALTRLKQLYLQGNNLNGVVPDHVCALRDLRVFGTDCDSFVDCICCTCCGAHECGAV